MQQYATTCNNPFNMQQYTTICNNMQKYVKNQPHTMYVATICNDMQEYATIILTPIISLHYAIIYNNMQ